MCLEGSPFSCGTLHHVQPKLASGLSPLKRQDKPPILQTPTIIRASHPTKSQATDSPDTSASAQRVESSQDRRKALLSSLTDQLKAVLARRPPSEAARTSDRLAEPKGELASVADFKLQRKPKGAQLFHCTFAFFFSRAGNEKG